MKKYIRFISIQFTILSAILTLAFVFKYYSWEKSVSPLRNKELIILGDSHTGVFQNNFFHNAYNLSQGADSYFLCYNKLKYLLSEDNNIKNVIVTFSPHNLTTHNDSKGTHSNWADRMKYRLSGLNYFLLDTNKYYPFSMYEYVKYHIFSLEIKNPILEGQEIFHSSFEPNQKQLVYRTNRHFVDPYSKKTAYSTTMEKYLKSIINICRNHGIDIYLVSLPLRSEYKDLIPPAIFDAYVRLEKDLNQQYGSIILNYHDDKVDPSFMRDYDHLNYEGAKLYAKKIISQLK